MCIYLFRCYWQYISRTVKPSQFLDRTFPHEALSLLGKLYSLQYAPFVSLFEVTPAIPIVDNTHVQQHTQKERDMIRTISFFLSTTLII